MLRSVQCALLSLPVVFLFACGNDCQKPNDCFSPKVCYKGVCQDPVSSDFICANDDDCSKDPGNGNGRPFICVATRCIINSATKTATVTDAGFTDA